MLAVPRTVDFLGCSCNNPRQHTQMGRSKLTLSCKLTFDLLKARSPYMVLYASNVIINVEKCIAIHLPVVVHFVSGFHEICGP